MMLAFTVTWIGVLIALAVICAVVYIARHVR